MLGRPRNEKQTEDADATRFIRSRGLTCHKPNEALDRDFISSIVHLDILSIQVELAISIGIDGTGERVAWVTRDVVGEHEDDLRVGNTKSLDCPVPSDDETIEALQVSASDKYT